MNWRYNPRSPLPARDLTYLTAFLDRFYGTLGVFGARLAFHDMEGRVGYVIVVSILNYKLEFVNGNVDVRNLDGEWLGTLELEVENDAR